MGRRIWIIPKDEEITDEVRASAQLNGCPEIVIGIPKALTGQVDDLPCAYEEPEPPDPVPPRSTHFGTLEAINVGAVRPARVKRVFQGINFFYDCFVTESIKDEYVSGGLKIGDYVLVHFDDSGEQVITHKIFRSW